MQVSAVLLSHDRPKNVRRILERMEACPLIDEIIVWHNGPRTSLPPYPRTSMSRMVVDSDHNQYTYGRFLGALLAKHPVVVTCDDDVLVDDWTPIIKGFHEMPSRYRVYATLDEEHLRSRAGTARMKLDADGNPVLVHEALLGFGSAFHVEDVMRIFGPYVERFGVDTCLRRKADRLFTMLHAREHCVEEAQFKYLAGWDEGLHMTLDHKQLSQDARARVMELLQVR